ncbi:SMI1/KNR4 family protein [Listeria welshimeri]|nr:SMI1/KNR4 family protein [Listeria welshimeri]MBC1659873.1 SMI1/KNR4 family protein [Listeria welshimeri]
MDKISSFGSLSVKEIEEIEKELKITFPKDYRNFLEICNGGIPKQNYLTLTIPEIGEEIVLGALLGKNDNKNFDLLSWNHEYSEDMIDSTIIIGTEYNSGLMILINQEEESGIYFWDNAYVFDNSSDEENVYKLCNSFTEFMDDLILDI